MASFKRIQIRPPVDADPVRGRLSNVTRQGEEQPQATAGSSKPGTAELWIAGTRQVASLPALDHRRALTIGRDPSAAIQLDDRYASRIHARIRWDARDGRHVITDAGSGNGTYVNGVRISGPVDLLDGTRIRIGRTNLVYRRGRQS